MTTATHKLVSPRLFYNKLSADFRNLYVTPQNNTFKKKILDILLEETKTKIFENDQNQTDDETLALVDFYENLKDLRSAFDNKTTKKDAELKEAAWHLHQKAQSGFEL